ncbi:MAG: OmpH family outer membrane protein [Blastocatellia bacterium]|nr:OmpH family outer membrane protein [Blastocatellia bacterium]
MRKNHVFFTLCFAILGFFLGSDYALAQSEPKIAFVDSRAFVSGINEFRQQAETLDREFKPQTDKIQQLVEQIQINEEVLKRTAAELLPDARQRKIDELEKQKLTYNRSLEDTKEAYAKRQEVILDPIRDKVIKALTAYAKDHGADVVLDLAPSVQSGSLAYMAPGVDITDEFIKFYNQTNPVAATGAGASPAKK